MRALALLVLMLVWPALGMAQTAATLVADTVTVSRAGTLTASGNVEVFYEGTRLSAASIGYDQSTDRLSIIGPIFIQTADGTIFTADRGSLDPRLENGLLQGARLVLDRQLQLAANQIDRVDGRYTQLNQVAATSCTVCGTQAPLWDIRARRVVHDQQEQQLYFEDAVFRVRGMPIFWVPRMRLPDPNLTRATGLLIPEFRSTDQLGVGVKLPYFIRLGDSRDLVIAPYLAPRTRTLEARYRQAYLNGDLAVAAAVTGDDILPGQTRGYLFADAQFTVWGDYTLGLNIETTSDRGYLLDYGYSDKDRLDSAVSLQRITGTSLFAGDLTFYQTLRDGEDTDELPPLVGELRYEKHLYPSGLGGQVTLTAEIDSHYRASDTDGDAGRDVTRLGTGALWRHDWTSRTGILGSVEGGVTLDYTRTWQDTSFATDTLRATPTVLATLRWPLARTTRTGTVHVLEPVAALGWSDVYGDPVANEDSTRVEFDEGNLFALSRFPGEDVTETGARLALGGTWSRIGAEGLVSRLTFGRILSQTDTADFSESSGLQGTASHWLLAGKLAFPTGFSIDGRSLLNDALSPTKSELRLAWDGDRIDLTASYVWLQADPDEDRDDSVSEWTFDADYVVNDRWSVGLNGRYDVAAEQAARAGVTVGWQNECVTVELSASRRYTSSTTVQPSTDFGLSVGLNGFSAGRSGAVPTRHCRN